jgi:hypothetical protein
MNFRAGIAPILEAIPAARQEEARHYGVHPYSHSKGVLRVTFQPSFPSFASVCAAIMGIFGGKTAASCKIVEYMCLRFHQSMVVSRV